VAGGLVGPIVRWLAGRGRKVRRRFRGSIIDLVPLGARGERLAERWLLKKGYSVLGRGVRAGGAEADLIVLDPDGRTIVIVEVKTRSSDRVPPEESLGAAKLRRLMRVAAALESSPQYRGRPMRIDAVAIVWPRGGEPRLRHYPGAYD
jgi:putative endonuclease